MKNTTRRIGAWVLAAVVSGVAAGTVGQCEEGWDERFIPAVFNYDTSPIAVIGSGPRATVFISAGRWEIRYEHPSRPFYWDGIEWQRSPGGLTANKKVVPQFVHAPHEPGAAYVFGRALRLEDGQFTTLARWDGSSWTSLQGGTNPMLLTPGPRSAPGHLAWVRQTMQGTRIVERIAGENREIGELEQDILPTAMLWFDDGTGDKLYMFGSFEAISNQPIRHAAVWDGQQWSALAEGPGIAISSAVVVEEAFGTAVYCTDWDDDKLYRWDGRGWTVFLGHDWPSGIEVIGAANFGEGRKLIAQRKDWQSDLTWLFEWTGLDWELMPHWVDGEVVALTTVSSMSGPEVYASGDFLSINDVPAKNLARWDGHRWTDVGTAQTGKGIRRAFAPLAVGDEGGPLLGNRLYVTTPHGRLRSGHQRLGLVASWDGLAWRSLGLIPNRLLTDALSLAFGDVGEGSRLFVGMSNYYGYDEIFTVGQYDGTTWQAVGQPSDIKGEIRKLLFYDAGDGPELYAIGDFWGVARHIARFDGSRWRPVGEPNDDCWDAAVLDDGSGPALYVGGMFTEIDGKEISALARWDGVEWTQVGEGLSGDGYDPGVRYAVPLHMGGKQYLLIKGGFDFDGWQGSLAAWDGQSWIDPGPLLGDSQWFERIVSVETPQGPRVISWFRGDDVWMQDGDQWRLITDDLDFNVWGATVSDFEGSETVYLVGAFTAVDGVPSDGFARFGCVRCLADFDADGDTDSSDVAAFLDLWMAGDIAADLNRDGSLDTRDVIEFFTLWNAGC